MDGKIDPTERIPEDILRITNEIKALLDKKGMGMEILRVIDYVDNIYRYQPQYFFYFCNAIKKCIEVDVDPYLLVNTGMVIEGIFDDVRAKIDISLKGKKLSSKRKRNDEDKEKYLKIHENYSSGNRIPLKELLSHEFGRQIKKDVAIYDKHKSRYNTVVKNLSRGNYDIDEKVFYDEFFIFLLNQKPHFSYIDPISGKIYNVDLTSDLDNKQNLFDSFINRDEPKNEHQIIIRNIVRDLLLQFSTNSTGLDV